MAKRTVLLTVLIGSCFISTVFAADPNCRDKYITPGRVEMFKQSLSGLRQAYEIFNAGVEDSNCSDDRELIFLHAVTGTTMLFIDNNDLSVKDSFLELAEEFGVEVLGDSFDTIDFNIPVDVNGCYQIPDGADPNKIGETINDSIIPGINDLIAELDSISDPPDDRFGIFFKPSETGLEEDLEVDYGEVLILKGLLLVFKGQLQAQLAYDVFIDVNDFVQVDEELIEGLLCGCYPDVNFAALSINEDFLKPYPNLLKVLPTPGHPEDGKAILAQAAEDWIDAIDYYFDAIDYITSETDSQENDLLYIDPNNTLLLDTVNEKLNTLRNSLANDRKMTYTAKRKTYAIYSGPTRIGKLVLEYNFTGIEGETGSLTFLNGLVQSPWEVEWFDIGGAGSEIEIELEYEVGGEWRGEGWFEATFTKNGKSFVDGEFEYWGPEWGWDSNSLSGLRGKLISTRVIEKVNIDLNPVFGNSRRYPDPVNPRDLLPQFDPNNQPICGTFGHGLGNDATLGGILPDMTQEDWCEGPPPRGPDLVIGKPTTTTIEVKTDEEVSIFVKVRNIGTEAAGDEFDVALFLSTDPNINSDGTNVAQYRCPDLAKGKSCTKKLIFTAPHDAGTYYLAAMADDGNNIAEADEDNNWGDIVTLTVEELVWKFGEFDGRKNVKLSVKDSIGTPVTFSLKGGGYGEIIDRSLDFNQVDVNDTTEKSVLLIATRGKGVKTSVGKITVNGPLKSIIAKTTDLVGAGISVTGGYVGSIQLGDLKNGADILIPGTGAVKGIRIKAGSLGDNTDIILGSPLKSITATQWVGGSLTALWASTISIKGDFGADVTLSGVDAPKNVTLKNAKIAGEFSGCHWKITGDIGNLKVSGTADSSTVCSTGSISSITLGASKDSDFLVGFNIDYVKRHAEDINDFTSNEVIKSVKIKGLKTDKYGVFFANSNFSAATIGSVKLINVDFVNDEIGGEDFGFWVKDTEEKYDLKSILYKSTVDKQDNFIWKQSRGDFPNHKDDFWAEIFL